MAPAISTAATSSTRRSSGTATPPTRSTGSERTPILRVRDPAGRRPSHRRSLTPGPAGTVRHHSERDVQRGREPRRWGYRLVLFRSSRDARGDGGPTTFTLDPTADLAGRRRVHRDRRPGRSATQTPTDPPDKMADDHTVLLDLSRRDPEVPRRHEIGRSRDHGRPHPSRADLHRERCRRRRLRGAAPACAASTCRTPVTATRPRLTGSSSSTAATRRRELGDGVTVTGAAGENQQTQISTLPPNRRDATAASADEVSLAVSSTLDPSVTEGMLVTLPPRTSRSPSTSGSVASARSSSPWRPPPQPTNVVAPPPARPRAPGAEQPQPDHRRRRLAGPEPRPDHLRPRWPAASAPTPCGVATPRPGSPAS